MKLFILACALAQASAYSRGYVRQPHAKPYPVLELEAIDFAAAPSAVDWSGNATTAIKDQGACGSCWAFSTVVGVEGQHAKATGNLVSLSEQMVVDCVKNEVSLLAGHVSRSKLWFAHRLFSLTSPPSVFSCCCRSCHTTTARAAWAARAA